MVIYFNAHFIFDYIRYMRFEHACVLIDVEFKLLIWIYLHNVIMMWPLFKVKLVGLILIISELKVVLTCRGLLSS